MDRKEVLDNIHTAAQVLIYCSRRIAIFQLSDAFYITETAKKQCCPYQRNNGIFSLFRFFSASVLRHTSKSYDNFYGK